VIDCDVLSEKTNTKFRPKSVLNISKTQPEEPRSETSQQERPKIRNAFEETPVELDEREVK